MTSHKTVLISTVSSNRAANTLFTVEKIRDHRNHCYYSGLSLRFSDPNLSIWFKDTIPSFEYGSEILDQGAPANGATL
jgi:hypothetical protein